MVKKKKNIPVGTINVLTKKGKKKGVKLVFKSGRKGQKTFKTRTSAVKFVEKKYNVKVKK